MMCQRGITTIHPRQQFCEDLMQFLQAWKTQNEVILLAGDFNEAIGTNVSGMTKLCADLGLVDLMQSHHDGIDTTPTYVRGNTRIDYVLATPPPCSCRMYSLRIRTIPAQIYRRPSRNVRRM
jgi:endonuclease/exonuclease/phosphatase family metal-dependent hydrolase